MNYRYISITSFVSFPFSFLILSFKKFPMLYCQGKYYLHLNDKEPKYRIAIYFISICCFEESQGEVALGIG